MLEGTRLDYLLPGYTGHIPKKEQFDPAIDETKRAHIPGYAGKVKSIKSKTCIPTHLDRSLKPLLRMNRW